jgi:hypothetical protein
MQSVKGDICGVENCRAVQYYTEDGLWFCKNGHQSAVGLFNSPIAELYLIRWPGSCSGSGR